MCNIRTQEIFVLTEILRNKAKLKFKKYTEEMIVSIVRMRPQVKEDFCVLMQESAGTALQCATG